MKHKSFGTRLIYSYVRNADESISVKHPAIVAVNMTAIKLRCLAPACTYCCLDETVFLGVCENVDATVGGMTAQHHIFVIKAADPVIFAKSLRCSIEQNGDNYLHLNDLQRQCYTFYSITNYLSPWVLSMMQLLSEWLWHSTHIGLRGSWI